jgi:hypothetical protein
MRRSLEDRSIDEQALRAWISKARELCAASDHAAIADEYIGRVFASSPSDPMDQVWPHRAVREVIEELGSAELDLGLQVAIFNQRGVTAREIIQEPDANSATGPQLCAHGRKRFRFPVLTFRGLHHASVGMPFVSTPQRMPALATWPSAARGH